MCWLNYILFRERNPSVPVAIKQNFLAAALLLLVPFPWVYANVCPEIQTVSGYRHIRALLPLSSLNTTFSGCLSSHNCPNIRKPASGIFPNN